MAMGDVLASVLPEDDFIKEHGKDWVLADGRSVPGTKYAKEVAPQVPDLRGLFLRGMNAGRKDAWADPEEDRVSGSSQDWSTALPKAGFHTDEQGGHDHGKPFVGSGAGHHESGPHQNPTHFPRLEKDGEHSHKVLGGDAETRPKNAAVFFYVDVGGSEFDKDLT